MSMKYKTITGTYAREMTRFLGDPHDTVISSIEVGDGIFQSVKGKEFSTWVGESLAVFCEGKAYTFFGHETSYRSRSGFAVKQFAYFGYCEAHLRDAVESLHSILLGRGFPKELSCRLVHQFGLNAFRLVHRNPYFLMKYDRVGFRRCDLLWLDLGLPPGRIKRQTLCLANALDAIDGSLWCLASEAESILRQQLTCSIPNPSKAIALGKRAGVIATKWTDGDQIDDLDGDTQWITSGRVAKVEKDICKVLLDSLHEVAIPWPEVTGNLSPHQQEELQIALMSSIGCLIGGGGTGKTFTVAELVKSISASEGGTSGILALAPTGKAAVRMTEALAAEGIRGVRGITIHSALARYGSDFDATTIIVDESSMIDCQLMQLLLNARRPGTRTLFVGDPYQLSPVGAGAPFRDMVKVLPSVGELNEIRRNAGTIAFAGQEIRSGIPFNVESEICIEEHKNLIAIECADATVGVTSAITRIKRAIPDINEFDDIQVIGIVNRKTDASVSELNEYLQEWFNGNRESHPGTPFRVGDKVIQTSNSWMIPCLIHDTGDEGVVRNKAGQIYVANGEIGRVVSVSSRGMTVEMLSPTRFVQVWNRKVEEGSEEGLTGSDFALAYAITAHRSQGSQWPAVIAVIDDSAAASRLMDRSLIYTMLTRASKVCVIVGSLAKARWACKKATIDNRKTFLKELYLEACADTVR
jgi:exodeoxyribonuclease V alpha subunit